ncbi:MAG: hypothetical protein ACHQX1_00415 [Candidatus Micrarchaeales archaeon]
MTINETKCYICAEEISMDNYYYISAGRLQQGVMSDTKSYSEYTLCGNCYPLVKAELVASIQMKKNKHNEKK